MAKRLTDSNKWSDNWYTNLPMDMKLVWNYLLDTCDHAGVYKVNLKLLRFQTDCERTESEIIEYLKDRIYIKGDKWFIPKFITFQYKNFFTSNTPAIKSARELLISHSIIEPSDNSFNRITEELSNDSITLIEPLSNGYITTKDMDMDKDMVIDKDTDKDKSIDIDKDMDMNEYMDKVFEEDSEKDKEFREDMYQLMDKEIVDNTRTHTNTGVINKILNNLIQLEDSNKHFQAVEDLEEIGGIDYISDILKWDDSVKRNWTQKIFSSNEIHSGTPV